MSLEDLRIGDWVRVKRNLGHPAWGRGVLPLEEVIAEASPVVDVRRRGSTASVRLASGFWYDTADGMQVDSGATLIEPVVT